MAKMYIREQAGRRVWECVYTMQSPRDSKKVRARKQYHSSEVRKLMNDRTSKRKLEGVLFANFGEDDFFCTLTFDDAHMPETRTQAQDFLKKYLRILRDVRKRRNDKLKYVYVIEDKHTRPHIHIVLNSSSIQNDMDEIISLWRYGSHVDVRHIKIKLLHSLSEYMCKERVPPGKQSWTPSKGLARPIVTRKIIPDNVSIQYPRNVSIKFDNAERSNKYGDFMFLSYLCSERTAKRKKKQNRKFAS